jgi:hypothetical protein
MIATMYSAGTPKSRSARASAARCTFQNAAPPAMRRSLTSMSRYSRQVRTFSAGALIAWSTASSRWTREKR